MGKQQLLFQVPATGVKVSKRKAATINRIKVDHTIAGRRYYLHRRLDRNMFTVDGATRIIDSRYNTFEEIPRKQQRYIRDLVALGYNVQYKILPQEELDALIKTAAPPEDFSKW